MGKKAVFILFTAILLVGVGFWGVFYIKKGQSKVSKYKGIKVSVYKSATCVCCISHISYLKKQGFEVKSKNLQELSSIKEKYKIPEDMQSCHTAIINDYFVEGHVPIEAIDKLLKERPEIDGISLPGMPSGSPGMPGSKLEPFQIYAVSDAESSNFISI